MPLMALRKMGAADFAASSAARLMLRMASSHCLPKPRFRSVFSTLDASGGRSIEESVNTGQLVSTFCGTAGEGFFETGYDIIGAKAFSATFKGSKGRFGAAKKTTLRVGHHGEKEQYDKGEGKLSHSRIFCVYK
jgi:hypothetical protein